MAKRKNNKLIYFIPILILIGLITLSYFGFIQQSFISTKDIIPIMGINIDNAVIEPNQTEMQVTYSLLPHPNIDRKQRGQFLIFFYVDNNYVYTTFDEYRNNLVQGQVTIPIDLESGEHTLRSDVMVFAPEYVGNQIRRPFSSCDEEEKMHSCGLSSDRVEFYERLPCEIRIEYYPLVQLNDGGSYDGYRCLDINLLKEQFPQVDAGDKVEWWKIWNLTDTFYVKENVDEIVSQKVQDIIEQQQIEQLTPEPVTNENYQEDIIPEEELEEIESFKYTDYLLYGGIIIILLIAIIYLIIRISKKPKKRKKR